MPQQWQLSYAHLLTVLHGCDNLRSHLTTCLITAQGLPPPPSSYPHAGLLGGQGGGVGWGSQGGPHALPGRCAADCGPRSWRVGGAGQKGREALGVHGWVDGVGLLGMCECVAHGFLGSGQGCGWAHWDRLQWLGASHQLSLAGS
jgi:hypothetical protein